MLDKNITNNLQWIDEAFSKYYVDELEAACCLTEGQNRDYFGDNITCYTIDYELNPVLRKNYRVALTWNFPYRCLFDFINKAIATNLQDFRRKLLLEKCEKLFLRMSPKEQKKFTSNYFYIYQELSGSNPNTDPSERILLWVSHARKIYHELFPTNKDLSVYGRVYANLNIQDLNISILFLLAPINYLKSSQ